MLGEMCPWNWRIIGWFLCFDLKKTNILRIVHHSSSSDRYTIPTNQFQFARKMIVSTKKYSTWLCWLLNCKYFYFRTFEFMTEDMWRWNVNSVIATSLQCLAKISHGSLWTKQKLRSNKILIVNDCLRALAINMAENFDLSIVQFPLLPSLPMLFIIFLPLL